MTISLREENTLISRASWKEESLYLKEFLAKNPLPNVVRLVKGSYHSLSSSSSSTTAILLLRSGRIKGLQAQSVQFKESRKISSLGPKYVIPEGFEGLFEILNEDGVAVKCIESVSELRRKSPHSFLLRESFKAFLSEKSSQDSLILSPGQIFTIEPQRENETFLEVRDSKLGSLYFPLESKGKFSPLASEKSISGLHSLTNLLNKRLPLMVRLIVGERPALKNSGTFSPELRLLTQIDEESLIALPLNGKDKFKPLPLPVSAVIKIQSVTNHKDILSSKEFESYIKLCLEAAKKFSTQIIVYDVSFGRDIRLHGLVKPNPPPPPFQSYYSRIRVPHLCNSKSNPDEIEQIYDYVRGLTPLPKGFHYWKNEASVPPEPPSLETLPSKKDALLLENKPVHPFFSSSEDLGRKNQFDENGKNPTSRFFHFTPSSQRIIIGSKHKFLKSKSGKSGSKEFNGPIRHHESPLFSLRYKSLSNLMGKRSENENEELTNSSNSGRITSGEDIRNVPEKKSRKLYLIRPKSLTNLVTESSESRNYHHESLNVTTQDSKNSFSSKATYGRKLGSNPFIGKKTLYM